MYIADRVFVPGTTLVGPRSNQTAFCTAVFICESFNVLIKTVMIKNGYNAYKVSNYVHM